MKRKYRRVGFTAAQSAELWERWKKGEGLKSIGRVFGKPSSCIFAHIRPSGGIMPPLRRRSRLALTLWEREEISRGLAAGRSVRSMAYALGRSPSTVSREIGRNGGDIQQDFSTKEPGRLLAVDLKSKEIAAVGSGEPVGNLDGLEPDGAGNWLTTDWVGGALYRIAADGTPTQLMDLNQGSADLEYDEANKLAIIPMMMDGNVKAFRID